MRNRKKSGIHQMEQKQLVLGSGEMRTVGMINSYIKNVSVHWRIGKIHLLGLGGGVFICFHLILFNIMSNFP